VYERNNDRYYESDDDEDEGSKRKEGKQKLDELRRKAARNIFPTKLGSSVLIPSETSSSGSSSSSLSKEGDLIDASMIGFNPGVEMTETNLGSADRLPILKNWNTFQELLESARKKKADEILRIKPSKINRERAAPNPYGGYPAESIEDLAKIVGKKNRGIKYNPDLNSANTAQIWLNKKLYNAPSEAVRNEILKYAVEEGDLDDNPDTRDNGIVYSDRNLGKFYLIDGNQLTSGQKKINQCNIYSAFQVREVRSDVLSSQYRSDLKAWLRKYPTPKEQQKHPFQNFE
jgi:hypothetical protein